MFLVKDMNPLKKDEIIKLCKEMKTSGYTADFYYTNDLEDIKYAALVDKYLHYYDIKRHGKE